MFSQLNGNLKDIFQKFTGKTRLSEKHVEGILRKVQLALLEADVALPVTKSFMESLKTKALGKEVFESLTPSQTLAKMVEEQLKILLGETHVELNLKGATPMVILMAGLQGSGKTTTTAKLAKRLLEQEKKVLVASTDVRRPAAILQLQQCAKQVGVDCYEASDQRSALDNAKSALQQAKQQQFDVLLVDTAGRSHVDAALMEELSTLHAALNPLESLLVLDSMMGQDALNTAKAFKACVPITGLILTKLDGDSRGGAALSARHVMEAPIKFLGMGEKLDALEPCYPDRLAARILGMGDINTLLEEAERKLDKKKFQQMTQKMSSGEQFDLDDFREQLRQMTQLGDMSKMLEKLPGLPMSADQQMKQIQKGQAQMRRNIAILNSMTPSERAFPDRVRGSHKRRITKGSGTTLPDFNRMMKQFTQMQKVMNKLGKKEGMLNILKKLPPELLKELY